MTHSPSRTTPHPSVPALWARYRDLEPGSAQACPAADYFCDNAADADICAELVLRGLKRATASALVEYAAAGEAVPEPGTLAIVTDWSGIARALIRTEEVSILRFGDVTEEQARLEGEGDGTLAWWRDAHRAFWERALAGTGHLVTDDLMIVFERFTLVLRA